MIEFATWIRTLLPVRIDAGPSGPQGLHFKLSSPDVKADSTVPQLHVYSGCGGQNVSPALEWHNPPSGTRSFAVTVYDPDASTGSGWWHWMMFDIPPTATGLSRGAGNPGGPRPAGAIEVHNDYGEVAYGGPCPPAGDRPHRYVFTVFALKIGHIALKSDSPAAMVGFNINANKIGEASFTATYGR